MRERPDVVDAAVSLMVESESGCDALTPALGDEEMQGCRVEVPQESRRDADEAQVLAPCGWCELDLGPRQ